MSPARARTRTVCSGVERANRAMRPPRLPRVNKSRTFNYLSFYSNGAVIYMSIVTNFIVSKSSTFDSSLGRYVLTKGEIKSDKLHLFIKINWKAEKCVQGKIFHWILGNNIWATSSVEVNLTCLGLYLWIICLPDQLHFFLLQLYFNILYAKPGKRMFLGLV